MLMEDNEPIDGAEYITLEDAGVIVMGISPDNGFRRTSSITTLSGMRR